MTETIFSPREMVILIPSQTNTQMVAHKEGREKTISFERIFSISKIHYTLGCLVLAFFFGPPGAVFLAYIQTKNVSDAIVASVSLFFGLELPFWPGVFGLAIFTVILFYCTYLIQDMRLKLLAAKKDILPILPGGDEAFDKAFAHVSNSWPPLALGAIVGILVTFDCYTSYLKYGIALPSLVFIVFFSFIWAIVAGTFLWIFFSSIWGVHKLGRDHIKLRHYSEEKTLGAKPIGLLSLSFTLSYLAGPGSFLLLVFLFPAASTPLFAAMLAFLIASGLIFFFFSLHSTHIKMEEEKNRERDAITQTVITSAKASNELGGEDSEPSMKQMSEAITHLTKALTANVAVDQVKNIPSWPIDLHILSQLAAMIITIACTLIANLIMQKWVPW